MAFKNETSERFYNWCKALIDRGELTSRQLSDIIGKYQNNPSNLLGALKSGKISVNIEWLISVQIALGVNPAMFLDKQSSELKDSKVKAIKDSDSDSESKDLPESFSSELADRLHQLFQKHGIEINNYARTRLKISRQQLHNYLNGSSKIPLHLAVTVCEDLGESLDIFRMSRLPTGQIQEANTFRSDVLKQKNGKSDVQLFIDQIGKSIDNKEDVSV